MKRWLALALLFLLIIAGCQPKPVPVCRATAKAVRTLDWWEGKGRRYGLSIDTSAIPSYYGFQATRDWGRVFWYQQYAPADVAMLVVLKMDMRPQVGNCPAGTYAWTQASVNLLFACEQPLIQTAVAHWPGMVYGIANEPNWGPYATPEVYAYAVNLYGAYIKALDPTARIMAGGILIDEGYAWPARQWLAWSREVITRTAGTIDIYGINPYAFYRLDEPELASGHTIEEIQVFHTLLDEYDPGKPIWVLEYGFYKAWPTDLIIDYMDEVNAWLDVNHRAYGIDRWFWFHGAHVCNADYDPCNSGMFDLPLNRNSATVIGDAYQTRFRVFVDHAGYARDLSRVRGSMTNPFASLAEAQQWGSAGAEIYDFRVSAVVGTVPGRRVYMPAVPDIGEFWN